MTPRIRRVRYVGGPYRAKRIAKRARIARRAVGIVVCLRRYDYAIAVIRLWRYGCGDTVAAV
jgi:hypothetical protein